MPLALTQAELEARHPEDAAVLCEFYLPELNDHAEPTWTLGLHSTERLRTETLAKAVQAAMPPLIAETERLQAGFTAPGAEPAREFVWTAATTSIQDHTQRLLGDRYTPEAGQSCAHVLLLLATREQTRMTVPDTRNNQPD